ncbi:structural protein [Synechococcus phage S-RIM2]|uniref:Structural protein n=1 Tax=Synechococcus phage S-RIM2 TaxID=687800 RepID=A0A1D7RFE2_9CAUD|nr:structural protein [Synechococcus phage S-RIM2]AOO00120.1 structural protein [Synechococcus phage S-RIM2]AOO03542.1 structural protein [Synechococcus phage S-RIM2]AOO06964.1 structural protein [Synechococcus phage S-RIM2]
MARQGLLGQAKPAAATNTVLYSAPVDSSASLVLTAASDGGADTYDVAVKEFDQKLTLDAANYLLHQGDVVTGYRFNLASNIPSTAAISPGATLTSGDSEKTAVFESYYIEPFTEVDVKAINIRAVTLNSATGTFVVGETVSKGTAPDTTTALVYAVEEGSGSTTIHIGPSTLNGSGTEFTDSDAITGGTSGATAAVSAGGVGTAQEEFVLSNDGLTFNMYLGVEFTVFDDRAYRFDVSDASMSGRDFSLSTTVNGEWGPDNTAGTADDGAELTTGKTSNGTPGSGGAYVQYDFSAATLTGNLYYYDGGTGTASNANYGGSDRYLTTSTDYSYTGVYVYDVDGTWVNATDSFEANGNSYTVQTQTSEAYGYVRSISGATLEVIKGKNSADFTTSSVFQDAPKDPNASRSAVGVNAVVTATDAIDADMYLRKDNAISDDSSEEVKSLVIGPGQRLLVESTTGNVAFNVVGFEDASSAFTVRTYSSAGGAGGSGSGGGS